jgi:lysophospholipase L1-like esterase
MKAFPLETSLTIVAVGLILTAAHQVQPSVRGPEPADLARLIAFGTQEAIAKAPAGPPSPEIASGISRPAVLLEDAGGALDHFYSALSRTEAGAIARVVHYGDSPTTADLITGDIRSMLQKRFGDAGHGFVLMDQPWAWYQHRGVKLSSFGWRPTAASQFRVQDGLFGLGGVTFTGDAPARTHFEFATRHSRFEVWFLRQPGGGLLTLSSKNHELTMIDTSDERPLAAVEQVIVQPAISELDVKIDRGTVRAFGIVAETGAPGVVYDSLGLNGGAISVLSRIFGAAHWIEELRHRNPDLVVINYGTNEADFDEFIDTEYESELREAIRRVRQALPRASILVMSPMDRGRWASDRIETMPTIPRIIDIQRRIANQSYCAFFNTFAAMGGPGAVARWRQSDPPLIAADLIHPHSAGARAIASALVNELMNGFARFKSRTQNSQDATAGAPQ